MAGRKDGQGGEVSALVAVVCVLLAAGAGRGGTVPGGLAAAVAVSDSGDCRGGVLELVRAIVFLPARMIRAI
jgi:hypothetical protein